MTDRIADPWGERTPYGAGESWPVRVDTQLADGRRRSRRGALGAVGVASCTPTATAIDIAVKDGRIVGVRGRASDRVNHGRLGPEGPLRLAGQRTGRTG